MHRQFLRFALAGAVGFAVDVGVLYLMLALGTGYYLGRAFSFMTAATTTWQINRRYTFSPHAEDHWFEEWMHYFLAMLLGGAVNYGCYAAVVFVTPKTVWLPVAAVAAGALPGLVVNFLGAKFWVFGRQAGQGG